MQLEEMKKNHFETMEAEEHYKVMKRVRRKAHDIIRVFSCSCGKSYGSEASMKNHIKLKHSHRN